MTKRRGISPMLAVIILMTISIIGGGMLYGIQNQIFVVGLSILEIRPIDLRLEKNTDGSCYVQSVFYNSGTELIQDIRIKTTLDSGEDFVRILPDLQAGLSPGDSIEDFFTPIRVECDNFTIANTYSIFVNASSAESSFSTIKSIKVENITRI
jgi:hypothetical protein